ncbi:MAG: tRNA preQ1(34) S-adenosylmethionine ribosyltransferase-isomerase QueA [Bdellovibrionales bacterium]
MLLSDLNYQYPESLIATEPVENSRVLVNEKTELYETDIYGLLDQFQAGDCLVLNNSKVVKKRVFCKIGPDRLHKELEVLFLNERESKPNQWEVLFPSSRLKKEEYLLLPNGLKAELIERGKPQTVLVDQKLDLDFFHAHGELPIPPYIQKSRDSRHQVAGDDEWYQTAWAEVYGSAASPTASLHFKAEHLDYLKAKGVKIEYITLHVGLGTFLPIQTDNLLEHVMHSEHVSIKKEVWARILATKEAGKKVWSLGTTVTRSLESQALNMFKEKEERYEGGTNLFITPGFDYKVIDVLLTNFHQPQTTLLSLVAAFTSLENLKNTYKYAVENKFRLFSYGDLSVWKKDSK